MLKFAVFFAMMFCLAELGQSKLRYASCKFHGERGDNYAAGYLRLKEDESGQVFGRFDLHVMDESMKGPFGVHVHVKGPRKTTCRRMLGHLNIGTGSVDEGNIGLFKLNGDVIHDMDFKLHPDLNLAVYKDEENGIVGRGIKLHLTHGTHGKSVCCKVTRDGPFEYEPMKENVKKSGHFHHHH